MIFLFTDFGSADLYLGQVKSVLVQHAPGVPVIDLLHDVPNYRVRAAAHLLSALSGQFTAACVCMAVVDPGVGGSRQAVVMQADGKYFIGPDNGLLSVLAERAAHRAYWRIDWQPADLSHSFHGRDLFAPIAASLAVGVFPGDKLTPIEALDVQLGAAGLAELIYVDHYGNAMTGLRAGSVAHSAQLIVNGHHLQYARTFTEVQAGSAFWYENSIGLVEVAANCANAAQSLSLAVGQPVTVD